MSERDRLFETTITEPGEFVFDERVVRVFPDMINRSVPGYATVVSMTAMLARRYAQPNTRIYDLGCSLGAVTLAMRAAVRAEAVEIIAVDSAAGMVEGLRAALEAEPGDGLLPVTVRRENILETPVERASVAVLNFTLQFIDPGDRAGLLAGIAAGLEPGGVLVLSEKIRFEDEEEQRLQNQWHHDFKRSQGYSDLEIARKRDALENVLQPETLAAHRERLAAAGFARVYRWQQGFNFVSLVAMR
ncbi:MAG: carboxy-S-adenosyl-L-methionine synthase CmoA [Xanthomonadales bacterium]|jgi:tRNA (cmo5U34)-methyltransferase|nr:carboxy-S-adenosyl-L-methionine synthase CmoA [Xanthomonadales bacterium]